MPARRAVAIIPLTLSMVVACSAKSPCDIPVGTPLSEIPSKSLVSYGYWSPEPPGSFVDCCDLGDAPDGGCAAKCPEPRVEWWLVGAPYVGDCEADDWPGSWQCEMYAVDGGVERSGGSCVN